MVAVLNKSSVVKDDEVKRMVAACDAQMREFCHDMELVKWNVRFGGNGYIKMVIVDTDADVPGALAYHDLQDGRPVGVVMAKTVLDSGHSMFGPAGVGVALSHELLETRADPYCNYGASNTGDGWQYWLEVCDAVEASDYEELEVYVSNYCMKHWFNPQGDPPFDKLRYLTAPFQLQEGGYQVRNKPGAEATLWGKAPSYHGWRTLERVRQVQEIAEHA